VNRPCQGFADLARGECNDALGWGGGRNAGYLKIVGAERGPTILLAHGFGCDQNLWRLVVDRLKSDFRLLLIDLVESGVVGSQALGRGKTPR
jgi:pimeloyl-ACP methyl ester carboxylesterase